ncbi:MAG TPA: high-potential iron-sulfur protein [Steroidobacteraceae bacterium]|nr:high-potential iron-sulfur protein [Steroidobacteraceae bacterium]
MAPARAAPAAARLPPLRESDPAARAVHYVTDARRAAGAQSGAACSNCSIYGTVSATEGSCTLFPGKLVKAAGWCSSWSGL